MSEEVGESQQTLIKQQDALKTKTHTHTIYGSPPVLGAKPAVGGRQGIHDEKQKTDRGGKRKESRLSWQDEVSPQG